MEIVMRKVLFALAAATLIATPATAALKVGDKAPDFNTMGAVGGKEFKLHLADMLKKGPVVLYFFPKAFTSGCTAEAHAFSQSIGDFRKAGAQVVGMSGDDLKTLHDFSTKECRSAFPVATATPEIQ
jgi:peroxiredoxin Q/BCP